MSSIDSAFSDDANVIALDTSGRPSRPADFFTSHHSQLQSNQARLSVDKEDLVTGVRYLSRETQLDETINGMYITRPRFHGVSKLRFKTVAVLRTF